MYTELTVMNVRGLGYRRFPNLHRVNIITGENGSGKTSLLEAVELLHSPWPMGTVLASNKRRDELDGPRRVKSGWHTRHMVSDEARIAKLEVRGLRTPAGASEPEAEREVTATVLREGKPVRVLQPEEWDTSVWSDSTEWIGDRPRLGQSPIGTRKTRRTVFVDGVSDTQSVCKWLEAHRNGDKASRTLMRMLGIAPTPIRQLAIGREAEGRRHRRLFVQTAKGATPRYGRVGAGTRRIVDLATALVAAENGILLVDGIEKDIAHDRMPAVWEHVESASRALDVQVFATVTDRHAWRASANASLAQPNAIGRIDLDEEPAAAGQTHLTESERSGA